VILFYSTLVELYGVFVEVVWFSAAKNKTNDRPAFGGSQGLISKTGFGLIKIKLFGAIRRHWAPLGAIKRH